MPVAIQTRTIGVAHDPPTGTSAELQIEYDDVTLRLTLIRIVNPTPFAAYVQARRAAGGGQVYTLSAPAGQTVEQTIPGQSASRLDVTITTNGRVDGVSYDFGFGTLP
jgi:hypothetical protein